MCKPVTLILKISLIKKQVKWKINDLEDKKTSQLAFVEQLEMYLFKKKIKLIMVFEKLFKTKLKNSINNYYDK